MEWTLWTVSGDVIEGDDISLLSSRLVSSLGWDATGLRFARTTHTVHHL